MSRRNGNSRGNDPLRPSTMDTVALIRAIETRFLDLCGAYLRIRGYKLQIPSILRADALRWRQTALRHRKADFRNTQTELKSIRAIAQWTVTVNALIRNQDPVEVDWGD